MSHPALAGCVGVALVGNPGRSPRLLANQLLEAIQAGAQATGTGAWDVLSKQQALAVWHRGRRVAEARTWVSSVPLGRPGTVSRARPLMAQWPLQAEGAVCADPRFSSSSLAWPQFPALPQDPMRARELASAQALPVALATLASSLANHPPAPPFVNAALGGDLALLSQELAVTDWDPAAVAAWWHVVEGLLDQEVPVEVFFPTDPDQLPVVRSLPNGGSTLREQVLRTLGAGLPPALRRPQRLAGLLKPPRELAFEPMEASCVDDVLRTWCSPPRFWSLRRTLVFQRLVASASAPELGDFARLPRGPAHRALDKLLAGARRGILPPPGSRLDQLPRLHDHAPHWPGWTALLSGLDEMGALAPPSQALLAQLRAQALDRTLDQGLPAGAAPGPARARL